METRPTAAKKKTNVREGAERIVPPLTGAMDMRQNNAPANLLRGVALSQDFRAKNLRLIKKGNYRSQLFLNFDRNP